MNNSFTNKLDGNLAMNTLLQTNGSAAISDIGSGRPILLLHGGGGTGTVSGLSHALATKARVLTPTHPGFDGTPRPAQLNSVAELARFYLQLVKALDLDDVQLIGSSIGGWIAAEMAAMAVVDATEKVRIGSLILLNPVGIQVPGEAVTDVSGLSRPELVRLASHNPEQVMASAPPPTPERIAQLATNATALAAYDSGAAMMAAGLRERLATVAAPTLVLWGESDGIASVAYGKAYAAAFGNGKFELITEAGHLPQIEQLSRTVQHIESFISTLDVVA
jgi:pimeloyl-ACP methyl ester carboxylesterase